MNEINKEDLRNFYDDLADVHDKITHLASRAYTVRGMGPTEKHEISVRLYQSWSEMMKVRERLWELYENNK